MTATPLPDPASPPVRSRTADRARADRQRGPSPRYLREVQRPEIREDIRTLAFFVRVNCDGNHRTLPRRPHESHAVTAGVYDDPGLRGVQAHGVPTLCQECSDHLAYGEARRVFCPLDPKPFCAECEIHCFIAAERAWNKQMMRYSGPRSLFHGYALEGAKHFALSVRRYSGKYARRILQRKDAAA